MLKTKHDLKKSASLVRQNTKHARILWSGELEQSSLTALRKLTRESGLSIASGEVLWLNHGWYVTSAGLLRVAKENGCDGIQARVVSTLSDARASRWVFKATVYKSPGSRGFIGYGDADPSNVSPLVRGAEMRVAETRAVNRALRKAYGIGLCSVEELGSVSHFAERSKNHEPSLPSHSSNGSSIGQPKLRDQLCVLIRQHNLDPILVKAYAADFCGTPTLKDASRDLVESFIFHLATTAKENRDGLVCKLNSYAQPVEVKL
ncbi:MAG TPA: hypothetical protein VFN26_04525 [Candidatus Acidoferrum sp.]|nr:hypothetical protein [Candidatus Acidoferrum sp.]